MRSFSTGVKAQDLRAAVRVGASVGLPLYTIYLLGRIDIAVFAAFGALTSLYGHSEPAERRIETQIAAGAGLFVTIAAAAVFSAAHGSQWVLALMLLAVVLLAGTLGAVMKWVPRGEIFFILVLLVIAGRPIAPGELLLALATSAGGAIVAILLTMLEIKGEKGSRSVAHRLRQRAAAGSGELEFERHAIVILVAAIGVMSAWFLALALNIGHPFWAPITVAALIPALVSADAVRRATNLVLGTSGGVCLAALLFSAAPGPLALVTMIVVCQAIAEAIVVRSYAIALLFLSPLAIGMSNMGRGLPWAPLLIARMIEAGLGTVVALVAIVIGRAVIARLAPVSAVGQ
jgi:hypothetical protein